MDSTLRPMSTSQVLDRTFSLYKANFLLFVGIAALPPALTLGQEVLAFFIRQSNTRVLSSLGAVLYFVGEAVATGATVYAVSRLHFGNSVRITQSYSAVRPLIVRIIGITIAIGLMAGGAVVLGYVTLFMPAFFAGRLTDLLGSGMDVASFVLGFPVFILCIFWALRIYCRYALSVPACVVEGTAVGDSLRRSKFLSKDHIFRIFLIYFLTALLGTTLTAALSIPNYIAKEVHQGPQPALLQVWDMIAKFLGGTLAGPIGTIAIALAYYDDRVRKEAFDLQLMMEAMGEPGPAAGATSTAIG
jgi:hypothetical protein